MVDVSRREKTVTTTEEEVVLVLSRSEAADLAEFLGHRMHVVNRTPDPFIQSVMDGLLGRVRQSEPDSKSEPKIGDRVRVVVDDLYLYTGKFVGRVGHIEKVWGTSVYLVRFGTGDGVHGDPENGRWYCKEVELVEEDEAPGTVVHNGVTYDLSAIYKDRDGDFWRLEERGSEVVADYRSQVRSYFHDTWNFTLPEIVTDYGPLERTDEAQ